MTLVPVAQFCIGCWFQVWRFSGDWSVFYDPNNYSLFYPNSCAVLRYKSPHASPMLGSWCISICGMLHNWAAERRRINRQVRETLRRPHGTSWLVHAVAGEGGLSIIGPARRRQQWCDRSLMIWSSSREDVLFIFCMLFCAWLNFPIFV